MELDRNGLEVLSRDECLRLLAESSLGRLGLTSGALPTVLPVNFALDDDRIVVRTDRGSKLDAAARNEVVAFEADDFDPLWHSGWSVVVTGVAEEVTDPTEVARLKVAPVSRWAPHGGGRLIAIATDRISGRRLREGPVRPMRRRD